MKNDLPLYHDDSHIIYVNGAYQNLNDSIGRLMHNFPCVNAKDMYNEELLERFRYFEKVEESLKIMAIPKTADNPH